MSSSKAQEQLGQVLVDFSTTGAFPEEEDVSAAYVNVTVLPATLELLSTAKAELETEIRQISKDSAPDVDEWIKNAKSIQDDIEESRKLANKIVRQAEADEHRFETQSEKETYAEFLVKEVSFNGQLLKALRSIQAVNDCLNRAEEEANQHKILLALRSLEDAFNQLAEIPLEKTTRAIRILNTRSFELRAQIHEHLLAIWNALVHIDPVEKTITIHQTLPVEDTSLADAVIGFRSYKELDKITQVFWESLYSIILQPRTDVLNQNLVSIQITENSIALSSTPIDSTIKALFIDMENTIQLLSRSFPVEFVESLSRRMMPILSTRILETWLESAVPPELDDMVAYQKALAQVSDFASKLDSLQWPGGDGLHDWVSGAPKVWLNKRREIALDWTRNQLSLGIGAPQLAERTEKRMVAREDGQHLNITGTTAVTQDWDAAWDSDEEKNELPAAQKSNGRNRSSMEEDRKASGVSTPAISPINGEDEDDAADAWGWGDDDATEPEPTPAEQTAEEPLARNLSPETREMTISEKYWTSSMPQPVFKTVVSIYEDGAKLSRPECEHIPIAPAAAGLFALPTLILAMYRAVSPYYYTIAPGGNMILYNDSIWLSEKLKDFVSEWAARDDLPRRAVLGVRLDGEIKVLESFGKRAYTTELNSQRTIIYDLLNGAQNFFQQDGQVSGELGHAIDAVIRHIRSQADLWKRILPYSACISATGSLVNAVATKLITDVFDLSDIGVDEAERTAGILAQVEQLDDLFIQKADDHSNGTETGVPLTSQFADKWMKMKFLGEVLQSNLKDVKFLWFESDLSLYFTSDEVVDLIHLSFEKNVAVRQAIREIKENPFPRGEEGM